jgi:autotransporter-associated beta strand protein
MHSGNTLSYLTKRTPRAAAMLILAAAAVSAVPSATLAAPLYWDTVDDSSGNDPGTGTWDTGTNWNDSSTGANPTGAWISGSDAVFATGGTNVATVSGTVSLNKLNTAITGVLTTNTTVNGGTLNFNTTTGGIAGFGSSDLGSLTINSNVTVSANQSWLPGGDTLVVVNGNISGAGVLSTSAVTNSSAPILTFNGTNSLGGITANSGSSSTRHDLYLSGATTLTGNLAFGSSTQGGARVYAGANLNVGGNVTFSSGGGTLYLGGDNTFTGSIALSSGVLVAIDKASGLGGNTKNLSVGSSTLRILGTSMTDFGSRTLTFGTSSTTFKLNIDDAANTFTVNKAITNAPTAGTGQAFEKLGNGTAVLTQTNTYSRATSVFGGVLNVDNNNGGSLLSTPTLTMSGGTFLLTGKNGGTTSQGTGNVTVAVAGSTIKADGGTSTSTALNLGTITATTIGSALNFVTTGTTTPVITTTSAADATGIYGGRITFNGNDWASTASSGPTFTLSAYSNYNNGGAFATSGTFTTVNGALSGSATLAGNLTYNTLKVSSTSATDNLAVGAANTLSLQDGGLLFTGSNDYEIKQGTLKSLTATTNSDLVVHQNASSNVLTISSVIANGVGTAATLTKTGPGTLVLTGANTYGGTTYILGGVLSVGLVTGNTNNLGANQNLGMFLNNGTLRYTGATNTRGTGGNRLGTMGGTIDVVNSGTALTVNGVFSDDVIGYAGGLTKAGPGTLILGASNTFTGGVKIAAGVLQVGNANALNGTGATTANIVSFTSGSTGSLRLNGFNPTVMGLNSDATTPGTTFIENNHATTPSTLTVNSTFASSYAGTIRDAVTTGASLTLVKIGGNSLTLKGANTYSGGTTISAGKLFANNTVGTSATGTGAVTVATNGTLAGNGYITGPVTSAGTISPGNSPDSLDVTGNVTIQDGGILLAEIGAGSTVGNGTTGTDLLNVGGTFNLSATNDILNLTGAANFDGTTKTIVTYGALASVFGTVTIDGSPISGTQSNFLVNGFNYQVDYGTGTSSAITLSVVPEPGMLSVLGLCAVGLLSRRKRRIA